MSHEILSVKLCELDEKVGRLHSRIHLSEAAGRSRVGQELEALREECEEAEFALGKNLRFSRAEILSAFSDAYDETERTLGRAKERVKECTAAFADEESAVEAKIVMAEYALDFAMLAADRALLMSMEAIEAQMKLEEKKN